MDGWMSWHTKRHWNIARGYYIQSGRRCKLRGVGDEEDGGGG